MKFPWMDRRVARLTAEIAEIQQQLREYRQAADVEARAGDEARSEARQLRVLLIECEAVRIGQGLQRHDDQKQMDELVALGIQQDKDEIARLAGENESLRGLLRQVVNELPHRNSGTDGNAPGHGHRTPGVWDGDNGPLSGKPCAWCAIWAAAKAEVERHG